MVNEVHKYIFSYYFIFYASRLKYYAPRGLKVFYCKHLRLIKYKYCIFKKTSAKSSMLYYETSSVTMVFPSTKKSTS